MMKLTWNNGEVPAHLEVKQVYGVVFTKDGRIMLMALEKNDKIIYSIAGGTPEAKDIDREATLRRELMEEISITISKPIMIGYQEVDEGNGKRPYAQVRMVAMIDEIKELMPDPDTGITYKRVLTHPTKAIEKLNWHNGEKLIEEAVKLAKINFGIKEFMDKDEIV